MNIERKLKDLIKNKGKNFAKNNELLLSLNPSSKEYAEESKKRKKFLQELKNISRLFSNEKDWCVIKIKDFPKGHSDLDILINPNKLKTFQKILAKEGYKVLKNYGDVDFNFNKGDENFTTDIQLGDYHTSLMHTNYVGWENILKKSKRKNLEGIKFLYLSNEDDFMIFCVHSIFSNDTTKNFAGNSTFNLSDIHHLSKISNEKNFDWNYVLEVSKKYGWEKAAYYSIIICSRVFPNNALSKGKKIFRKELSKRSAEKINNKIPNELSFPHKIPLSVLMRFCLTKTIKDKSLRTFFGYSKWLIYNKFAVLLKKLILGK